MKTKHNKKRNTGFVFEALVREMTKSVLEGNKKNQKEISSILRECFSPGTELSKELDCYRTLQTSDSTNAHTAERLLDQAKSRYAGLNRGMIQEEQDSIISRVNRSLSKNVFNNHVPNYKNLATIAQILGDNISLSQRRLFEGQIIETLVGTSATAGGEPAPEVDEIVIRSFLKRFDSSYDNFLPEQKNLLRRYILQFTDDGAEFSIFLNEELRRIKKEVVASKVMEEIHNDADMLAATKSVLHLIKQFSTAPITEAELKKILKLQHLVSEYQS
jgi:hypothetical protein